MGNNNVFAMASFSIAMVLSSISVFPEAKTLSTLDEIAAWAQENNISYQEAVLTARSAELAIPDLILLKTSTLATSYSNYSDSSSSTSSSVKKGLTVKATIPVLDQVSLSSSLSDDLSGSVAATVNPLLHSDTREQARVTWEKALAAASEAGRTASATAIKDALSWMSAARNLETKQQAVKVQEDTYEATKQANAIDPKTTTVDDLLTALKDLSTARANLVTAQATERKAQGSLYTALGATRNEIDVARIDIDTLSSSLTALKAALASATDSGVAETYAAKIASLTVQGDKVALDAIWDYEPSLALSGTMAISSNGTITPKLSGTLTLSPDYFMHDEKSTARATLDLAQKSFALQRTADQNSYDQAVATVRAAAITTDANKVAVEQAKSVAQVAAFSLKSGDGSVLENDTAILSLAEAEDTLYQSLVDEYSAWLDLAALATGN